MKKILFISHEASLTGAPILLLRLIRALKKLAHFEIVILIRDGGELEPEFANLGKTWVWNSPYREGIFRRIAKRIFPGMLSELNKHQLEIIKQISNVEIVFSNTVTNVKLLRTLPINGKRIFNYLHELQVGVGLVAQPDDLAYLHSISEKIFFPSDAVKKFLLDHCKFEESRLSKLKYIIPPFDDTARPAKSENFVVGFVGTLGWRKGAELVPLLMREIIVFRQIRNIHFVWIGIDKVKRAYTFLMSDLTKLGIAEYFTAVEKVSDATGRLAEIDVLSMISREDAFPLVVLEAATAEVPTICFSGAGGAEEFVSDDAGICVPYLDIRAMSDAIIRLKDDLLLKKTLGRRAKEKLQPYMSPDAIVEELVNHFDHKTLQMVPLAK